MKIENLERDRSAWFCFSKSEGQDIIKAMKRRISDCERTIRKIENNPKNEGQVRFSERIREQRASIEFCNELIKNLS